MSDTVCERCGAFGNIGHGWVEGDCTLPHRSHSRRLVDGGRVCRPCVDRWDEWLTEIPDLYTTLDTVLYVTDIASTDERVSHGKRTGSPSPIRLTAWALYWNEVNAKTTDQDGTIRSGYLGANLPDIPAVLAGWAQAIYEENYEGNAVIARTAYAGASWLRANIALIAASPLLDDFDAELRWVRRALHQAHGITDPEPLFGCLEITCQGNVWPMTAGSPACDQCGRRYGTLDQVRALGFALPERRRARLAHAQDGPGRA